MHSGNEIGPFRAIEESTLAQLTPSEARSDIFAWYGLIGTLGLTPFPHRFAIFPSDTWCLGLAFGNFSSGWLLERLRAGYGWDAVRAYRVVIFAYAGFGLVKLLLTFLLSNECETLKKRQIETPIQNPVEESPLLSNTTNISKSRHRLLPAISNESGTVLLKLCFLFAIDSVASGLVPQ